MVIEYYGKWPSLRILLFIEPRGIHLVVVGDAFVQLFALLWRYLLYKLRWDTRIEAIRLDDSLR